MEITLKLRLTIKPDPKLQRCISIGQAMVLLMTSLAFATFAVCVTVDSLEQLMEDQIHRLHGILGYGSLLVFIIMIVANIALF